MFIIPWAILQEGTYAGEGGVNLSSWRANPLSQRITTLQMWWFHNSNNPVDSTGIRSVKITINCNEL